jgi:UDP:flavonoid glycosyltransferase YjiC (YdhE family)
LTIVFYISGHGFGHATRDLEVIRQIHQQQPAARIIVRTSVPESFLKKSVRAPIDVQPCQTDTGIAQIDSLRLDEAETIRRAAAFYRTFDRRAAAEATILESVGASVVVGDVPPLAFAAAARAAIPSIALANFTWDWIYAGYAAFRENAPDVLTTIGEAYAKASLALRLPFAGGFETMPTVRDVPLVARRSRRTRDENRRLLDLDDKRPVVLASFGGHQTAIEYGRIASTNDVTLALTDYEAQSMRELGAYDGRLRCFTTEVLDAADIRYEDLVAAADVVVSKPGYGIVSECIANQAALLYTSRGAFGENDVLIAGMKSVLRSRFISQEDLRAGRWEPSIRALLAEPGPPERMRTDGAEVVASAILQRLDGSG